MKKGFWHKRIPTTFAFILLFVSIWVTSILVQQQAIFTQHAAPDKTPKNVETSNITDSAFTVTFVSSDSSVAAISVGEKGATPATIFDDRNKIHGTQTSFYSHSITVSNLKAQTEYDFVILSDGQTYNRNGQPYTVTTGPLLGPSTSTGTIVGKAILPDGGGADDTLVVAQIEDSQLLTTLTDGEGNFSIPIDKVRTSDLKSYLSFNQDSKISITLTRQDLSSKISATVASAPLLPTVTLSNTYNFADLQTQESATASSLLTVPTQKVIAGSISITNPKENATFVDNKPLFQGVALPGNTVDVTIESLKANVIAGSNGYWSYRPDSSLSAGPHKITAKTLDQFGITKSLDVDFSIFASGTQVAQSATPSATPIVTIKPTATRAPTQIPTPTPTSPPATSAGISPTPVITSTPILTQVPTQIPTVTIVPTLSPTPFPTAIPTVIPTTIPFNKPVVTPPPTGSTSAIVLTFISALLISGGAALLFLL